MQTYPQTPGEAAAPDLPAERQRARQALIQSGEADRVAASLDPRDARALMAFGASAAQAIGRTSDELLRGMTGRPSEDSGELLEALAGVMARIDDASVIPGAAPAQSKGSGGGLFARVRNDSDAAPVILSGAAKVAQSKGSGGGLFAPAQNHSAASPVILSGAAKAAQSKNLKPGLLNRLLGKRAAGNSADETLARLDELGGDLDRVFVRLKAYTALLERDNRQLNSLSEANLGYYRELQKYILAGERAIQMLQQRLARLEAGGGDAAADFEIQTLRNALATLERRVQDLRASELVAMQTIPMIQSMRRNNRLLIDKIDAAFIVTLPAFRAGLAAAILEKRRQLRGEAMAALNARANAAPGAVAVQPGGASLADLRRGVLNGIDEVRRLTAAADAQAKQDRAKLEAANRK